MKIRFVLGLIFILTIGLLLPEVAAQKSKGDAIYLKNGSIVTGKITQNDSLAGIKIENKCGIWLYQNHEIDSLGSKTGGKYFVAKPNGYFNISSVGLLFGQGESGADVVSSITMVNGYKLLPGFTGGIGLGYEHYDWGVLPLFADARYYFTNQGFSPFLFAQAGYSFTLEQNFENNNWGNQITKTYGGSMFSGGAGIRAGIARHSAILISLSYRFQKLSYDSFNYWDSGAARRTFTNYNRIALTVGFLFE